MKLKFFLPAIVLAWSGEASFAQKCERFYASPNPQLSSFNDVLLVMRKNPYDPENLPIIPLAMWKKIGERLTLFVAKRSFEILEDQRDYRRQSLEKPIHSMGVGLVGRLEMFNTRWSGVFSGGTFPVLARASISQGNPYKLDRDGGAQKRSTAMAIKVFGTQDLDNPVRTANAVFQNDLNGLLQTDGKAINFLESAQTNHPSLNILKVRKSYELLTLAGVAFGSFKTPKDRTRQFPFINPQIRPVHSLAELDVQDVNQIKTPTWLKIEPRVPAKHVRESDFRLEIAESIQASGEIIYDVFASDYKTPSGEIQWIPAGKLVFTEAILSDAVDRNLLFHHDSLNSKRTGKPFEIPKPSRQYVPIAEERQ